MDRLTGDFKGASVFATVEQARQYNRLRQYEDTGLTPDEIAALRAEVERLHGVLKMLVADETAYQDGKIPSDADRVKEIEALRAELATAEKAIYDTETYMDLGSGKYAYKVIKDYQSKKEAARAALGEDMHE